MVRKDLSLISLVPKWSGSESAVSLEEFFENIESALKICRWHSSDCMQIVALKLTDSARTFYNTCLELHAEDATWDKFKKAFRERFGDVHTDQYHFIRLQTARQAKHEGPQEFTDRCKTLAQKIMCKDSDPVAQRIHRENAERMLLASFVAGLSGEVGKQIKFQSPRDLRQALTTALAVREALKQERFAETFTRSSTSRLGFQTGRTGNLPKVIAQGAQLTTRERGGMRAAQIGQRPQVALGTSKPERNLGAMSAKGEGTSRGSAPRGQNAGKPVRPGKKNPSERSNRSRSPGDEPRHAREKGTYKDTRIQGNE